MKQTIVFALGCSLAAMALAKLPAPSEEAAAKAAEAAAKAAWSGKVANYQLCKSMDRTAAYYFKTAKAAGKPTQPPVETPPCVEPGPFVYTPAPPAAPAAAVAAPATAPAPAAAASPAKS
ncbi:MAG: hypothetical protein IAE92_08185 [Burkholderiaceae bacterium]|nr:hypothetical protein [Burkholderiaceae bacterium]